MTTDEPNVPTHDHSFDDWAHPYMHTGDHPWTSPFGPGHSHGTVTGRLTPNEPKLPRLPAAGPSTPDDPIVSIELYRPSRICVSDYVVTDHPTDAANLLDRAASILNELARRGAFTDGELTTETARWFTDYDGLARS